MENYSSEEKEKYSNITNELGMEHTKQTSRWLEEKR